MKKSILFVAMLSLMATTFAQNNNESFFSLKKDWTKIIGYSYQPGYPYGISLAGGSFLSITALATAFIVGVITNLIVNNGKMSSGEDNMVSGHAENMGNVKDPEKK